MANLRACIFTRKNLRVSIYKIPKHPDKTHVLLPGNTRNTLQAPPSIKLFMPIHKRDIPLHLIIASHRSSTYNTVRYPTKILHSLVSYTPNHISNPEKFLNIIRNITLKPANKLVRFDVVSHVYLRPYPERNALSPRNASSTTLPYKTGPTSP